MEMKKQKLRDLAIAAIHLLVDDDLPTLTNLKVDETIEVINQIKTALANDVRSHGGIVDFVMATSNISQNRVRIVLKQYEGQLWRYTRGQSNIHIYNLIEAPVINPESFNPDC